MPQRIYATKLNIFDTFLSVSVVDFKQVNVSWEVIVNYIRRCDTRE